MNGHYSVITNFGCHWTCPYCIVRKTGLNVPVTDMQATLRTISRESEHHPMRFLSFSGGGDPLFPMREPEASKRVAFYREAIRRAGDCLTETEMHTSYFQCGRNVAQVMQQVRFSRVVYHMRPTSLSDDVALALPRKWFNGQKVRVVYVVTPDFTPERIDRIADLVAGNNVVNELSFRQKVNPDNTIDHTCEKYLKAGHQKRWWYIQQDDYNMYVVNDRLYTRFSDIGKEDHR